MRALHVVENLDRGAVENWLVRMFRHARARGTKLDWTFYCALGKEGALDGEVRKLGGRIVHSPVPLGKTRAFMRTLRDELRQGSYEVLHCHHDLVSAVYLSAAIGLPLRSRIVHVHNADEAVLTPNWLKQRLLPKPMRLICLALADKIVGISHHTLDTFLAGRERRPGRDIVHYYGVDPTPFLEAQGDRTAFRRELGLPPDALILLFAGRLVPEKNPHFALDVLAELRALEPRAVGVFVGSGSEEASLQKRMAAIGLTDTTRFLGWRADVPDIMCCCDWFILPRPERPMEGFGLAVVEAQLAGLRLMLSKGIADDPILPGACFERLSLHAGPREWAKAAVKLLRLPKPRTQAALTELLQSPMNMQTAWDGLVKLHSI